MSDVTLTYKGNTILELDDSDSKLIKTAGKYLEDDIELDYVKSGGGGSSYTLLKGTAQPAAGIGQDGDVYLQYTALDGEIVSTYVKVSGTWQALVGSDVDAVSNSGLYTGTEALPPASLGTDGDYYYQRVNLQQSIQSANTSSFSGSNSMAYATKFTVAQPVTVTHLFAMTKESRTGKLQIGTTAQIMAKTVSATFPANRWIEVPLESPIQLSTGTEYIVKVVIDNNYGSGNVAYTQSTSNITYNSWFSYVATYYGASWPGTQESGVYPLVGITCIIGDGVYRIIKQFHKDSGVWSEIT